MPYDDAMKYYGSDKPDLRFGMSFVELKSSEVDLVSGAGFGIFDQAQAVIGICAKGAASYTRKQIDALVEYVKRPQIGATGIIYCRKDENGELKSSVDKFYDSEKLSKWSEAFGAENGDLMLILAGDNIHKVRKQLNELRLHLGSELGLRNPNEFAPLWVVDFPLLEWDEESERYHAMHHPFTSPLPQDRNKMFTDPGNVKANAYDLVINGVEIGGGSIRIHDEELQSEMFKLLGFSAEEAQAQFGFLLNAFKYGAPPHGGIALGFDRLCSLFGGSDSIRDFIAFPKNNSGRDVMIDAPSALTKEQLKDLSID
jgi:aspartyl-tRNA synthetase